MFCTSATCFVHQLHVLWDGYLFIPSVFTPMMPNSWNKSYLGHLSPWNFALHFLILKSVNNQSPAYPMSQ